MQRIQDELRDEEGSSTCINECTHALPMICSIHLELLVVDCISSGCSRERVPGPPGLNVVTIDGLIDVTRQVVQRHLGVAVHWPAARHMFSLPGHTAKASCAWASWRLQHGLVKDGPAILVSTQLAWTSMVNHQNCKTL